MSLHHNRPPRDVHTVPDPRLFLAHPSGGHSFGYLNEIRYQAERLEAGHIRLRFGEHFGPNRGYGSAKHKSKGPPCGNPLSVEGKSQRLLS